jgi:hypothetical protein
MKTKMTARIFSVMKEKFSVLTHAEIVDSVQCIEKCA